MKIIKRSLLLSTSLLALVLVGCADDEVVAQIAALGDAHTPPHYLAYVRTVGRLLVAEDHGRVVGFGGVVPVPDAEGSTAMVTDLFVHPDARGRGIGAQLFRHAADWARGQGYGPLGLETQSVNVAACRFYARQGCILGAIHRYGYAGVPNVAHEVMLLWYFDL